MKAAGAPGILQEMLRADGEQLNTRRTIQLGGVDVVRPPPPPPPEVQVPAHHHQGGGRSSPGVDARIASASRDCDTLQNDTVASCIQACLVRTCEVK